MSENTVRFDEVEKKVLRYLEKRFLDDEAKGVFATVMPEEIISDNALDDHKGMRLITRFDDLNIINDSDLSGKVEIQPIVCDLVAQLEFQIANAPPPDRWESAKTWALSKRWFVYLILIPFFGLPCVVGVCKLIEWLCR